MLLKTVILSRAYEPQKDAFSSSQTPDITKELKNIAILNLKQYYMHCYGVLANYFKWNHVVAMSSDSYTSNILTFCMQHEIELDVSFNLIYSFPMIALNIPGNL